MAKTNFTGLDLLEGAMKGLRSNKSIAAKGINATLDGGLDVYKVGKEVLSGNKKGMEAIESVYKTAKNADGERIWNAGKIAGSYIAVSAGTRAVTGGGIYRDRHGNTDLPGIPFI